MKRSLVVATRRVDWYAPATRLRREAALSAIAAAQ